MKWRKPVVGTRQGRKIPDRVGFPQKPQRGSTDLLTENSTPGVTGDQNAINLDRDRIEEMEEKS